jgi:hypothetical protein
MAPLRQMMVVGSLCLTRLNAFRQSEYGQISLHGTSNDDPCEESCYTMKPRLFWELFHRDPALVRAKADENCVSPNCYGCRRTDKDKYKTTTMPDCSKPAEEIQMPDRQSAQIDQQAPEKQQSEEFPSPSQEVLEPLVDNLSPDEEQSQEIHVAAAADPCLSRVASDEVCDYANTAWCLPPSNNVGASCRKNGKPLCCSKLTVVAAPEVPSPVTEPEDRSATTLGSSEPSPEVASETEDFAATPLEVPVPVEDEGNVCGDGDFAFEAVTRRGATVQVCRNTVSKRFAKKICCNDLLKQQLDEQEAAINGCSQVKETHCRGETFDRKRNTYKGKVPDTYTCRTHYLCKDKKGEIAFGPVSSVAGCGKLHLEARKACVAVKV